jgi:hypothetical protein
VSFSPFEALPNSVLANPDEQTHLSGPSRTLHPATVNRSTPPTRSSRYLPGTTTLPQDNEPTARPPAFSLRQSGPTAQQRQSSPHQQDAQEGSTEEDKSVLHTGRFRLPGSTPENRQRKATVATDTRLDPPSEVRLGATTDNRNAESNHEADDHAPDKRGLHPPTTPLNNLTDSFPEAAGGRDPDLSVPGLGISPLEGTYDTERGVNLPLEPYHEVHSGSAIALIDSLTEPLLTHEAQDVENLSRTGKNAPDVVALTASSVAAYSEESAAIEARPPQQTPDVPPRRSSVSLQSMPSDEQAVRSQEPGSKAYGSEAITLIGSLAEHLLVSKAQTADSASASGAHHNGLVRSVPAHAGEQPEEEAVSDRSLFALLESVDGEPADQLPSSSNRSDLVEGIIDSAPDRYMDAQTIAALVNEVLVGQARRHGVDLS